MTAITKPVKRVAAAKLPHGYADRLVITLYPGAIIEVREPRRRGVTFDLGTMYVRALIDEAWKNGARRKRKSGPRG